MLAFYFPWDERSTWSDSQLLDQPLQLYSTEDPADVLRQMQQAKSAGLDGVIVSFQGKDIGGGWNHRRMLLVLQAAQQTGLRVSVQIETFAAHLPNQPGPPHPDALAAWFTDIVDLYGTHPAYLRVDGRPVIFMYVWHFVDEQVWRTALARVRATGRQLFVLADDERASALAMADSTYTFAGSLFARDLNVYARDLAWRCAPGICSAPTMAHNGSASSRSARATTNAACAIGPRVSCSIGAAASSTTTMERRHRERRRLGGHQLMERVVGEQPDRAGRRTAKPMCGARSSGRPCSGTRPGPTRRCADSTPGANDPSMKPRSTLFLLLLASVTVPAATSLEAARQAQADHECFVFARLKDAAPFVSDAAECAVPASPASTFRSRTR